MSSISSRTPEGFPNHCSICGNSATIEMSSMGDAPCPSCGQLLGWLQNDSQVIQGFLETESVELSGETAISTLGMDSLDFMELVMEIEEELGVSFDDVNYDDIKSVNDVIRLIQQQRQPAGTGEADAPD